jgi:hypothetical protein
MKPEDDPNQLPTREVLEGVLEIATREQLDARRRALRGKRLPGGFHLGRQLITHVPDGFEGEAGRGGI